MLSVIIITKNEEELIADCIKSIKEIADEILVVDSYSTDNTLKTAQKSGAKVIQNQFIDFADQRNFAFFQAFNRKEKSEPANKNWILYLDADERTTIEFNKEVLSIINNYGNDSEIGGYFINRKTYFYGTDWNLTEKIQRLFYKDRFIEWKGKVHETPVIKGRFGLMSSHVL